MSGEERIELSSWGDWMTWGVGGGWKQPIRWMHDNKDEWILLYTSVIMGEKKALEDFKTYSNYSPLEKEKYFNYIHDLFMRSLDREHERLTKAIEEKARVGKDGKNSEISSVGVCDTEDRGQGEGNGKTIE